LEGVIQQSQNSTATYRLTVDIGKDLEEKFAGWEYFSRVEFTIARGR
jgi:hypothetical protein